VGVGVTRPPELWIRLGLEERPEVHVVADTYEDQQRLIQWLRRSSALRDLPRVVAELHEQRSKAWPWRWGGAS
jgi:hypothetical protein